MLKVDDVLRLAEAIDESAGVYDGEEVAALLRDIAHGIAVESLIDWARARDE